MIYRLWLGCLVVAVGQFAVGCTAENMRFLSSTAHTVSEVSDTVSVQGVELANTACPELTSGEIDKIELAGSPAVQAETKAFLSAVHNTIDYATTVNRVIRARCSDIGVDLGLSRKQFEKQEQGPYGGAEELCTDTARAFAKTGARVVLHYEAPACSTSLDTVTACLAACGNPIGSAELSAGCQGGKLVGICDGSCHGSCEGESHVTCGGTCDDSCHGACDAQFHGTCSGKCSGTCDGAAANGACAGSCDGACDAGAQGTCGGKCSGECSGKCSAEGEPKCDGKCSGECGGKYEAVSCTGKFNPPKLDSTCAASCVLQAQSAVTCARPTIKAQVLGGNEAKIKASIEQEMPQVVQIALEATSHTTELVKALVSTGAKLRGDLGPIGGKGLTCVASGVTLALASAAKVTHSVNASFQLKAVAGGKIGL